MDISVLIWIFNNVDYTTITCRCLIPDRKFGCLALSLNQHIFIFDFKSFVLLLLFSCLLSSNLISQTKQTPFSVPCLWARHNHYSLLIIPTQIIHWDTCRRTFIIIITRYSRYVIILTRYSRYIILARYSELFFLCICLIWETLHINMNYSYFYLVLD